MSRARAERWEEELQLVTAEMSRVLNNLQLKAQWWRALPGRRSIQEIDILKGLDTYAQEQAAISESLAIKFSSFWLQVLFDNQQVIPSKWPEPFVLYAQMHLG